VTFSTGYHVAGNIDGDEVKSNRDAAEDDGQQAQAA